MMVVSLKCAHRSALVCCLAALAACGNSSGDLADARREGVIDATGGSDAVVTVPDGASIASADATLAVDAHIEVDASSPIDAAPPIDAPFVSPFSGGGRGTASDPFVIENLSDLILATNSEFSASSFLLAVDLDVSNTAFAPFENFSGTFDGGGHQISNLTLTEDSTVYDCVGLFRSSSGTISDLSVVNPAIAITRTSFVGALVGCNTGLVVRDQVLGGSVSADYFAGGLIGSQESSLPALAGVESCFSSATVTASNAGGLVGEMYTGTFVLDSYATGAVTGSQNSNYGQGIAAGLVASNQGGIVWRTYASNVDVSDSQSQAGLVYANSGVVGESYWNSDSSGQTVAIDGGTPLTAEQLTDASNFVDWDFSTVWGITTGQSPTLVPGGNVAPVTLPIAITATGGTPQSVTLNGFDFDGDALTFRIVSPPKFGAVSVVAGDQVTYTGDWNGDPDQFTYQAIDSHGATSPITTITSTVTPGCNPAEPGFLHGGDGSAVSPYVLSTVDELQLVHQYMYCNFLMANDIDLTGIAFVPYGSANVGFSATFDGGGHEIQNLTYAALTDNESIGLFVSVNTGTVKNLGVTNEDLSDTSATSFAQVGGLAGTLGSATITNVYTSGTVTSVGGRAAGISAYSSGTLSFVSSSDTVSGGDFSGGLIGWQSSGSISDSFATGSVTSVSPSGGAMGGLIGQSQFDLVQRSFATGDVNVPDGLAGGFIGYSVSAFTGTGIFDCYSTGSVTSSGQYGGAGGFMGLHGEYGPANLSRVFALGAVTATAGATSGGFLGQPNQSNNGNLTVTDAFWDIDTTGQATSVQNMGTGESDASMKQQSTFTDFDFTNVWTMGPSGYPILR